MNIKGGPNIVLDGLMLYLDPANPNSFQSGQTAWNDISRGGYAGAISDNVTLIEGPNCFLVSGVTIPTISLIQINPAAISFAAGDEYTLDFYIKFRTGSRTSFHMLCGQAATNPFVAILANALGGSNWRIAWRATGGVYTYSTNITNYDIEDNWINITLKVKSDASCSFYINGQYIEDLILTTGALAIRRLASGYQSDGNFYCLDGYFGPAKIYNRALTDQEILQNFNALRERFSL